MGREEDASSLTCLFGEREPLRNAADVRPESAKQLNRRPPDGSENNKNTKINKRSDPVPVQLIQLIV